MERPAFSQIAAVAFGEAGDEFGLSVDAEVSENDFGVAVDGVDAEAEVVGDFLAAPAFAEAVEDGAVARVEVGDFVAGLVGEGFIVEPRDFA